MSIQPPANQPALPIAPVSGAPGSGANTEDEVAPSPLMERYLLGLMIASLAISISGLAFVYGFHLNDFLSFANLSPAVRAVIVDSSMACGSYFGRKFLMRRHKTGYDWFWSLFWLLVTAAGTSVSWFSNDLAVTSQGTVVTQALLHQGGWEAFDAATVNKVIAFLPIAFVLIYLVAPRRLKAAPKVVETRTPEQIREDWEREQALLQVDLQRRQLLAAQRGHGVGSTIAAARAGIFAGMGRDEAEVRTERQIVDQMRVLLVRHGYKSDDQARKMKNRAVRLLAEAQGLWDAPSNGPTAKALGPTYAEHLAELRKEAVRRGWLTAEEIAEERDLFPPDIALRYEGIEAQLTQAREEEARQAALEAKAERQQREQAALARTTAVTQNTMRSPISSRAALAAEPQKPAPSLASAPLATKRDGFTPQELADRLSKSRGTILGWMQLADADPLKIFPSEVYVDERGHRRIMPAVYLRLSRVLEAQQQQKDGTRRGSRESDPRMPAVTVAETPGAEQQNGNHPDTNE